jgi:hypothetical protein
LDSKEPKIFKQASHRQGKPGKEVWRSAIIKELKSKEERKVWEIIEAKDIPEDMKPIICKWIFKRKRCSLH